jgi:hypothetical protein
MANTLTFDGRELEEFIKTELPIYLKSIAGIEEKDFHYQDNISREEPIFPCFSFEIFSQGTDERKIDSDNIENATKILLDLDVYVNEESSSPLSTRDLANIFSYGIAQFINEKLGMKILQNDRVPNTYEGIFRKKIRAIGLVDNSEYIIYTN